MIGWTGRLRLRRRGPARKLMRDAEAIQLFERTNAIERLVVARQVARAATA